VRFWVAGNDDLNRLCGTYNEAYQYAKELRDKHGFDVPLHAIDELREDAIDEAKLYFGPDSAVADILSRNAKLGKLAAKMARALGVKRMWCYGDCMREFECHMQNCPIESALQELGIEVTE
jgi:hypothetical protein